MCLKCAPNSNAPASSDHFLDCQCNAGYSGPDGSVCTACVAGKYKSVGGESLCVECPRNSTSEIGSLNTSDCRCLPGFTANKGECVVCSAGTYKLITSDAACANCEPGKFKDTRGTGLCSPCPKGTTSPFGSNTSKACTCAPGFVGINEEMPSLQELKVL